MSTALSSVVSVNPRAIFTPRTLVTDAAVVSGFGMKGTFPLYRQGSIGEERVEEERRLCYVGITRAKSLLYMSWRQALTLHGRRDLGLQPMQPSRFLLAVPPKCCKVLAWSVFKGGLEDVPSADWMASSAGKASPSKLPRNGFRKGLSSKGLTATESHRQTSGSGVGGEKSVKNSKKRNYSGGSKGSGWGGKSSKPTTRIIPGAKTQVFDAAFLAKLKAERAAKEAKEGG